MARKRKTPPAAEAVPAVVADAPVAVLEATPAPAAAEPEALPAVEFDTETTPVQEPEVPMPEADLAPVEPVAIEPAAPEMVSGGLGPLRHFEPLRASRLTPAFAYLTGAMPPEANAVPSMMSGVEKRILFNLARRHYTGKGIIVDAGIFLGASTVCFGEGIRRNTAAEQIHQNWAKPIISFERGIINTGMPAFFERHKVTGMGAVGETFAPAVRANIAPVAEMVDLRIGDIMETATNVTSPVEILFLDVLKLPEISRLAIRQFFPRLIPGQSIVVQQDYFIDLLPFIRTDQEFFADHFTYIGEAGSSALFLCTRAITEDAIDRLEAGVSVEDQDRMATIALQRSADPARRFMMALSKTRLLRQIRDEDVAFDYLTFVKREYPEQAASTLPRLRQALQAVERLWARPA